MHKGRLEAFSDGVLAILITIMVLELKVPHDKTIQSLQPLLPVLISYVLSFIYLGIYWNNHHHLLQTVSHVNGRILWANLHLLFWLSLIPFGTGWVGENNFAPVPISFYGFNLLMAAIAYYLLQGQILLYHDPDSILARAIGSDRKGKMSLFLYSSAICLSFFNQWIALGIYILVAFIWLIPDKRIEQIFEEDHNKR